MAAEDKPARIGRIETLVLEARADDSYFSFSQLDSDKQHILASQLVFKAAAISGLSLSQNEYFCDELEKQIVKFFNQFGFSNLNEKEFELALQINLARRFTMPSGIELDNIEPFGAFVNVAYLAKVLDNYMVIRNMIDRKLKNFIDGNGYNY